MKRVFYRSPFIPEEWIAAHGFGPVRFVPGAANGHGLIADTEGVCPFMRGFVNEAAEADVAAVVLTTVCDQMRRGFELLGEVMGDKVFLFNLPSTWQGIEPENLYKRELERLGTFLIKNGGKKVSQDELGRLMLECETNRSLFLPEEGEGVAIALLGGALSSQDNHIVDLVRELGGRIVLDATEAGERTMPALFDRTELETDPVGELVAAYFGTIQDAFRRPNSGLYDWFRERVEQRKPQGIVFFRQVWCDLWHAEVQRFSNLFDIPLLDIDLNGGESVVRNRTRVEAFMETLR